MPGISSAKENGVSPLYKKISVILTPHPAPSPLNGVYIHVCKYNRSRG
jgi:hypothetical protein